MSPQLKYQIFTGPFDKDWLVAELLYGDEHIGELVEWGEKLVLFPSKNDKILTFSVDEFINTIKAAREEVRFIPKSDEDMDNQ